MVDLITVKLEEICTQVTDGTHDSPKLISHGYPLIKGKDINKGYIDFENCDYISEEDHLKVISRSKPEYGDILFANIGNSIGDMAFVSTTKEFSIKNVALIKADITKVDNLYLYYYMLNKDFQNEIKSTKQGAAQPFISLNLLRNFELKINKKLKIQTKIAKVLSNYDDLIENNNKRIKILEEMAQKIYKEWFVDFKFPNHETATFKQTDLGKIPKDWSVVTLNQILSLQHGYAFKSAQFSDLKTDKILVRMGNFQNFGGIQFEDNTKYLIEGEQYQEKYVLNANDLVMVLSDVTREGRIIGNVGIIPTDNNTYLLNQRVAKIITEDLYKKYLLLLFNSKQFKNHCLSRADSATVLNLCNDDIYDYSISLPTNEVLIKFEDTVSPILSEIETIIMKNKILKQTRDLLLPRLISGEIDVENMEIV